MEDQKWHMPILVWGYRVDVRSPHPFDLVDLREEQSHFQDVLWLNYRCDSHFHVCCFASSSRAGFQYQRFFLLMRGWKRERNKETLDPLGFNRSLTRKKYGKIEHRMKYYI